MAKTKAKQPGYKSDVLNNPPITGADLGNLVLPARTFSSGKVGFGYSGPVTLMVEVDGKKVPYTFQASINITAHHSELWPKVRPQKGEGQQAESSK